MNSQSAKKVTGYAHPLYCQSLGEFGTPLELSRCGGWILKRRIPGRANYDGMGCYPLFACQDWRQLEADLEDLGSELVSLAIVADPFGQHDPDYLRRCFRDVVIPFKEHFVVDLSFSLDTLRPRIIIATLVRAYKRLRSSNVLKQVGSSTIGSHFVLIS